MMMMNTALFLDHHIQGGPKKLTRYVYTPITSPNIERFSKIFHCRNQKKIVVKLLIKIPLHFIYVAAQPCEMSDITQVGDDTDRLRDQR